MLLTYVSSFLSETYKFDDFLAFDGFDLRQVSGFQQVAVSFINKTDRHDALYS
jgi:hypothetical protein